MVDLQSVGTASHAGRRDLEETVTAAREGCRDAFEDLVRATYQDTFSLALRLTGNLDDAHDVAQDTYLRAFRGMRRFRGDAQLGTWLYRITANCAATLGSRRRRHQHLELTDAVAVADERPEHDPVARADAADARARVRAALEGLPPRLRTVVVLRDIYDLPHEAIAERLGISVGAAKVRLHRGRRRLRDALYGPSPAEARHDGRAKEGAADGTPAEGTDPAGGGVGGALAEVVAMAPERPRR
jgi:RNA polymerase sigma-70 factor (ECF subfamily)